MLTTELYRDYTEVMQGFYRDYTGICRGFLRISEDLRATLHAIQLSNVLWHGVLDFNFRVWRQEFRTEHGFGHSAMIVLGCQCILW